MNTIPGTVCCLLCRGMVIYKDGDKSRFKAHMNNEHGAFFDIDYLLASCLLEKDQKDAVAKTVECSGKANPMLEENDLTDGVTLREASYNPPSELILKVEKTDSDYPLDSDIQGVSNKVQFETQEAMQQYQKKETIKRKNIECDKCGQNYATKQSLRVHKERMHTADGNIKSERYDDPRMNPNFMYPRNTEYASESMQIAENNFGVGNSVSESYNQRNFDSNPDTNYQNSSNERYNLIDHPRDAIRNQSHNDDLDKVLHEATKQNPEYINQFLDASRTRNSEDNELLPSQSSLAKKRRADELDDIMEETTNQTEMLQEKDDSGFPVGENESNSSERFYCQAENCGKSYTSKSNKQIHEKKAHNILSLRARNKKLKSSSEEQEAQNGDVEVMWKEKSNLKEKESNLHWDELEKIRAQYYNSPGRLETDKPDTQDQLKKNDDNFQQKLGAPVSHSFSLDSTRESDETASDEQVYSKTDIDITQSKYFTRNAKVITSARGKSVGLFTEIPSGLPEHWKMRTLETTNKAGGKVVLKHYLTPELKVLKTGLAVVEYLRLKGELETEQLLEVASTLNISEGKLKSLYL